MTCVTSWSPPGVLIDRLPWYGWSAHWSPGRTTGQPGPTSPGRAGIGLGGAGSGTGALPVGPAGAPAAGGVHRSAPASSSMPPRRRLLDHHVVILGVRGIAGEVVIMTD